MDYNEDNGFQESEIYGVLNNPGTDEAFDFLEEKLGGADPGVYLDVSTAKFAGEKSSEVHLALNGSPDDLKEESESSYWNMIDSDEDFHRVHLNEGVLCLRFNAGYEGDLDTSILSGDLEINVPSPENVDEGIKEVAYQATEENNVDLDL